MKSEVSMPEVLTQVDEDDRDFYKSAAEETADRYHSFIEATKMNVVDLPSPRVPRTAQSERSRLERNIIDAVMREDRKGMLTPWIEDARNALIAFESSQAE